MLSSDHAAAAHAQLGEGKPCDSEFVSPITRMGGCERFLHKIISIEQRMAATICMAYSENLKQNLFLLLHEFKLQFIYTSLSMKRELQILQ